MFVEIIFCFVSAASAHVLVVLTKTYLYLVHSFVIIVLGLERTYWSVEAHTRKMGTVSTQTSAGSPVVHAQVYADRYLELLDAPAELSVAGTSSFFKVSVQMTSPDVGPYACLVFHDPVATPLTVEELQQQFSGPYSDFTESQVASSLR